jgi:hypothetical protein
VERCLLAAEGRRLLRIGMGLQARPLFDASLKSGLPFVEQGFHGWPVNTIKENTPSTVPTGIKKQLKIDAAKPA